MRPPPHIITTIALGLALATIASSASAATNPWRAPAGLQATCAELPAACAAAPATGSSPDPWRGHVIAWVDGAGRSHTRTTAAGDFMNFVEALRAATMGARNASGMVIALDDAGRMLFRLEPGSAAEAAYPAIEDALDADPNALTGSLSETTAVQELASASPRAAGVSATTAVAAASSEVLAQCDCQTLQDAVSAAITALKSAQDLQEAALLQLTLAQDALVIACMWLGKVGCKLAKRAVKAAFWHWWKAREFVMTAQDTLASAESLLRRCLNRVRNDPACNPGDVSGDPVSGTQARVRLTLSEPRRAFAMALA